MAPPLTRRRPHPATSPMSTTASIPRKGEPRRPGRSDEHGLFVSNSTCGACVGLSWRNQILLFKGKKVSVKGDTTLEAFGFSDGTEVQVLGSTVGGGFKEQGQTQMRVRQITSPTLESRSTDGQRFTQAYSPSSRFNASVLNLSRCFHDIQPPEHTGGRMHSAQ
jgi:hypothetical protein